MKAATRCSCRISRGSSVACAVTLGCDLLITGDAKLAQCPEVKTELVVP